MCIIVNHQLKGGFQQIIRGFWISKVVVSNQTGSRRWSNFHLHRQLKNVLSESNTLLYTPVGCILIVSGIYRNVFDSLSTFFNCQCKWKFGHRLETVWLHTTTLRIQQPLIICWNPPFKWWFTVSVIIYNWFILTIILKRNWIQLSAHFVVPFYMFYIGLMMADLRPKHVALVWTDIAQFYSCVDIQFCFRLQYTHSLTATQRDGLC